MWSSSSGLLLCGLFVASVGGCGGGSYEPTTQYASPQSVGVPDTDSAASTSPSDAPASDINLIAYQPEALQEGKTAPPRPAVIPPQVERKIIFNATLDIVVEEFDGVPARIRDLAAGHGGFISKSNIQADAGRSRSGTWTVRVPVVQYDAFVGAAGGLGTLEKSAEDSREVTAEFRELESRLRNKQREEERLLDHLKTEAGNLQQILVIEKELSRVRAEAEQLAGQLQLLRDLTSLSTVVVNVREIEEYVPAEPPTFVAQISDTWSESFGALTSLGQVAVLVVVALAPWMAVACVPLLFAMVIYRMQRRPKAA
jgi:hypothetical protein